MRICLIATLFIALAVPMLAQQKPAASAEPTAVIETTAGNLQCKLFPKEAPKTVANFIGLAQGTKDWRDPATGQTKHGVPLYNGTIFHRVIPGFMIQGGDPAGNGTGDPGYRFQDETTPALTFDRPGRLAMANAGPNTNGSQFFITEAAFTGRQADMLNGHYSIFGQCDDASVDLVKKIARMPRDANDRPSTPVMINRIVIEQAGVKTAPATGPKKPAQQ